MSIDEYLIGVPDELLNKDGRRYKQLALDSIKKRRVVASGVAHSVSPIKPTNSVNINITFKEDPKKIAKKIEEAINNYLKQWE